MKKNSETTYVFDKSDLEGLVKSHLSGVEGEYGEVSIVFDVGRESVGHGMQERDELVFRGIKATVKNSEH